MWIFEMVYDACLFLEVFHSADSAEGKVDSLQLILEKQNSIVSQHYLTMLFTLFPLEEGLHQQKEHFSTDGRHIELVFFHLYLQARFVAFGFLFLNRLVSDNSLLLNLFNYWLVLLLFLSIFSILNNKFRCHFWILEDADQ